MTLVLDKPVRLSDIDQALRHLERNRIQTFFPDAGPLRRELYRRHIAFFDAGTTYKERLFMAANRVGKTEAGAYEATCHLTGIYPPWWKGRRFSRAVKGWACGTTGETTRDIVQHALLGPPEAIGTGMIPGHLIVKVKRRSRGLADAIESILVSMPRARRV